MPIYSKRRRIFAPKTDELKDLGSGLLEVAKREKNREEKLRNLLEETVKMKRLVKEILVLIDKGSRTSINEKQRKALADKANKKMDELRALNERHTKAYFEANAIKPWGPTKFNVDFTFENPNK